METLLLNRDSEIEQHRDDYMQGIQDPSHHWHGLIGETDLERDQAPDPGEEGSSTHTSLSKTLF